MNAARDLMFRSLLGGVMVAAALSAAARDTRAEGASAASDLLDLSLDQLASVEITSVSRHAEKLTDAPSAVFRLSGEDIRRSGATTVPEALRLVPGLQVARVNANTWAISARGFNERFANKMLVLVDGRTVYSPLFSGVSWDVQTLPLGEIDRIEVIRGPGATMWGANAVNGVINIITRSSAATNGGAVQMVTGSRNRAAAAFRYGGSVGGRGHLRLNLAGFAADAYHGPDGSPAHDQWNIGEGSFRADAKWSPSGTLLVEGGYQRAGMDGLWRRFLIDPPAVVDAKLDQDYRGTHLLARFEQAREDGPSSSLQAFFDQNDRNIAPVLRDRRTTFDIDGTRRLPFGFGALALGGGFRWSRDDERGTDDVQFRQPKRETRLYTGFVHGELGSAEDRAQLSLGTKLEHNGYTGLEIQPNARGLVRLDRRQNLWAAFSRAVRTPSRMEADVRFRRALITGVQDLPPILVTVNGTARFDAEVLLASELGYRAQPRANLALDLAGFYNDYRNLRGMTADSLRVVAAGTGIVLEAPYTFNNQHVAHAYGLEAVLDWRPLKSWRLQGSATFMDMRTPGNPSLPGNNPDRQFLFRSEMNLTPHVELDAALRVVSRLEAQRVPAYAALDLRVGWRPLPGFDLDLVGRNLVAGRHLEFVDEFLEVRSTEIPSDFYVKAAWRF